MQTTLLDFTLAYAIFEREGEIDSVPVKQYGIQVEKWHRGCQTERVSIANISPSIDQVLSLCKLMCAHQVTPAAALDVVEDWLVSEELEVPALLSREVAQITSA